MRNKASTSLISFILFSSLSFTHCGDKSTDNTTENNSAVVARIYDQTLTTKDIVDWVPKDVNSKDSAILMKDKIQEWAKTQLLSQYASKQLSQSTLKEIDTKVEDYRQELLSNYLSKEDVVDTVVSESTIKKYYAKYKENFKLNNEIVRVNYAIYPKRALSQDDLNLVYEAITTGKLNSETSELLSKSSSYKINDRTWSNFSEYQMKMPFPKIKFPDEFLKNSKNLRLSDSLNIYLIKIVDYKVKGDLEPYEYSFKKIKSMLKVQKLTNTSETIKQQLLDNAIQKEAFTIY